MDYEDFTKSSDIDFSKVNVVEEETKIKYLHFMTRPSVTSNITEINKRVIESAYSDECPTFSDDCSFLFIPRLKNVFAPSIDVYNCSSEDFYRDKDPIDRTDPSYVCSIRI